MFIYEVTATVQDQIAANFEQYMVEEHIPDLLATGHFAAAFFAKNKSVYQIVYHADSQQHLDDYFAKDAERLRAGVAGRFPTGIEFSRQILEIIKLFPGS